MNAEQRLSNVITRIFNKEQVQVLTDIIHALPIEVRTQYKREIQSYIGGLIGTNNGKLVMLKEHVKNGYLATSIYNMFEWYIDDVNTDLTDLTNCL